LPSIDAPGYELSPDFQMPDLLPPAAHSNSFEGTLLPIHRHNIPAEISTQLILEVDGMYG
jgi:hypothetical protein